MLRLTTDQNQIERVLFADCPMQSIGIRMKMRALYKAYGLAHDFCSYYISQDEQAAAVLYEGALFFSDTLYRSLHWEDSLSLLPVQNISIHIAGTWRTSATTESMFHTDSRSESAH